MAHAMYAQSGPAAMAPPQKPETFMLSSEAQQSLPQDAQVALQQVDNLKYFLISAPVDWTTDQYIRRFLLPTGEYVSCVLWNNLFHISGTDIVRCLSFRFQAFGRPVKNTKKFEEGIFSDLRNLKSGTDAALEEPKSPFLDFLYKNNCIRTQKKQKVFYWYSVPHDRLFLDALERDLKREKMGQEATTMAVSEPALSFEYDATQSLFEQLTKVQQTNSSSLAAQQQQQQPQLPPPPPPPPGSLSTVAQSQQQQQQSRQSTHELQQQQQQQQRTPLPQAHAYSQSASTSPMMRAVDSMPPPPPQQQQQQQLSAQPLSALPDDLATMAYQPLAMTPTLVQQIKRESDFGRVQYDHNGVPLSQGQPRHASVPAYGLEYSPAPSFVSSHFEDYSNRGISYEPITPPQQALGLGAEPAYIANEETGLYTAIPDHMSGLNALMHLPPSNLSGTQFPSAARSGYGLGSSAFANVEGSPTYKQRRRRSSIPPGVAAIVAAAAANAHPHSAHRPSDLRRSVSASVVPLAEADEMAEETSPNLPYGHGHGRERQMSRQLMDFSRHSTPLATIEDTVQPLSLQTDFSHLPSGGLSSGSPAPSATRKVLQRPGGPIRRAHSATVMEIGPYPQKSHSCPIPTCGRLFKRLEHLKRHVRTHTQERPYICSHCNKAFSRSDNLAQHKRTHDRGDGSDGSVSYSGGEEDESSPLDDGPYDGGDADHVLASLEETSPNTEQTYPSSAITSLHTQTPLGGPGGGAGSSSSAFGRGSISHQGYGMMAPSQLITQQQMM